MQFLQILAAAGLFTAGSSLPTAENSETIVRRGDSLIGPINCGTGNPNFNLPPQDCFDGAEEFANFVGTGADGKVDLAGYFHGKFSSTWNGVTFFACDASKGGKTITSALVLAVLRQGQAMNIACGGNQAGWEKSNDLIIGRTFTGDAFCA